MSRNHTDYSQMLKSPQTDFCVILINEIINILAPTQISQPDCDIHDFANFESFESFNPPSPTVALFNQFESLGAPNVQVSYDELL